MQNYATSVANRERNKRKNRDPDNVPYDHSRVILGQSSYSPSRDKPWDSPSQCNKNGYVNANYIDSYSRKKAYIVAQSPFDRISCIDFWQMIYEKNVVQIVSLTGLVEESPLSGEEFTRCLQYWPEANCAAKTNAELEDNFVDLSEQVGMQSYGNIRVLLIETVRYAYFTVRVFRFTHLGSGASRTVTQYHFTQWTELFIPGASLLQRVQANLIFLEFFFRVKISTRIEDGPILVHCGSGTTRSAVFCAFDRLMQQLAHERQVSVAKTCQHLRQQRANMISSRQHYFLLYDLLYEAALAGPAIVLHSDLRNTFALMNCLNPQTGRSFMWEQWSLLHNYCPAADQLSDLRVALLVANLGKNRFPRAFDLLPPESSRVVLPTSFDGSESHTPSKVGQRDSYLNVGYINAVSVDGARLRDDFLLTQTPLNNTVTDFWRLVQSQSISCIVDLEPESYGHDAIAQYWSPEPNSKYKHWDWRSDLLKHFCHNNCPCLVTRNKPVS
ncbi:hypothetical protein Ciccas_008322 [Cichlidogyrus casuarinus]|uniref:protein-tyrosine-phosphatase n=1 Tax=Cichlidogyrus casuarinus TaxID=1844966 RepID=A0ABD2Q126_9PLAT